MVKINSKKYNVFIAAGGCILLLLVFFSPVIFGNRTLVPTDILNTMTLPYSFGKTVHVQNHFLNDVVCQYYPYTYHTYTAIRSGACGYWNPYILGGYPQYALTMAGNYDITNLLMACITPFHKAYHVHLLLLFLIAGINAYLLFTYLAFSPLISFFVAACYMFNSMFITTFYFPWIFAAFVWMPLILLFVDKAWKKRTVVDTLYAGLFLGFALMAASIQTASFLFVCMGMYLVGSMITSYISSRKLLLRRCILLTIGVAVVGSAVAAVALIPTIHLFMKDLHLGGGVHSLGTPRTFMQRILGIPLAVSFMFPDLAGTVRAYDFTKLANSTLMFFNGYIGFMPLIFGLYAVKNVKKNLGTLPFLLLAFFGAVIPLFTPALKFVYHRFFIVYIVGICGLAAYGMKIFYAEKNMQRLMKFVKSVTVIILVYIIVFIIGNILVKLYYPAIYHYAEQFVRNHLAMANMRAGNESWYIQRVAKVFQFYDLFSIRVIVSMFLYIACPLVLYCYVKKWLSNKMSLILIMLITISQLCLFGRLWIPMVDKNTYPLYPTDKVISYLENDHSRYRVLILNTNPKKHPIYRPNSLSMHGIETINGYESIEPLHLKYLTNGLDIDLLRLCNVKYVITHSGAHLESNKMKKVITNYHGIEMYEIVDPYPRAFMRYKYVNEDAETFLNNLKAHKCNTGTTVYMSGSSSREMNETGESAYSIKEEIYNRNTIQYEINTQKAGCLVISNSYYPGWKCTVDGETQPIEKVDYIIWGVNIPAGKHTVKFVFKPMDIRIGLSISMLAIFLIVFFGYYRRNNGYTIG